MKQILFALFLTCTFAHADMGGTDGTNRTPTAKEAKKSLPATTNYSVPVTTEEFSRAQVSFELLGSGLLYSIYGSYRLIDKLAFNVGFSYWSADLGTTSATATTTGTAKFLIFPVSLSLLLGGGNHNFEVLAGGLINSVSITGLNAGTSTADKFANTGFIPNFGIGYRYWPKDGGFHFRVLAEMFIASSSVLPWIGLSFGYAF